MTNKMILIALLFLGTAAFAFTRQEASPPTHQMHMQMGRMEMMKDCPMGMAGMAAMADVNVEAADTPDGVTLTFTTKTGDADALRARVRAYVEMMKKMQHTKE
jgi:hypothetical protein